MIRRIIQYFLFASIIMSFLCNCNSNGDKYSIKHTSILIDSIGSEKGSLMYKMYCLTCHDYTKSGTYYQPSLDSMYILLEKNQLNFTYSIQPHEVLIPKQDSINFENIRSYIKRKYHPW